MIIINRPKLPILEAESCAVIALQCYQWLKEKIISEEGRKQQGKLKDLSPIAERLGCTLPQLAVGGSPLSLPGWLGKG